jgi:glycosyltransferase involved in cell wall biosynthesis
MKIQFVAEKYPPVVGGGETHLHQIAEGLAARGHDVTVVTEKVPDTAEARAYRGGRVNVREITGLTAACQRFDCQEALPNLIAEFDRDEPDIVHVINYVPALLTSLIRPKVPGHLVVSLFETLVPGTRVFDLWSNWELELTLQHGLAANLRPDLHLCGSGTYQSWIRDAGFTEPSVVVPFGTELEHFTGDAAQRDTWRKTHGLEDATIVLVPARPVPRKRFEDVITALMQVRRTVPNACAVLTAPAGRSNLEYIARLRTVTEDLGMTDAVHWVTDLTWQDMPQLYAAADAVVMPASHESWGIALTEGMASRRPVITTDIEGHWEVVSHERTGLLYPPTDVDALAAALIRVFTTDVSGMVERAYTEAVSRFSVDACVAGHERAYTDLLAAKRTDKDNAS